MKIPFFLIAACMLCFASFSQSNYYWYQGQKVSVTELKSKRYITYKNISDTTILRQRLSLPSSRLERLNHFIPSASTKRYKSRNISPRTSIVIEDQGFSNRTRFTQNEVTYESNFYRTEEGEEAGLSHLFYVKLKQPSDINRLEYLAKQNKVEILGNNQFMPLWYTLSCDRNSAGNALEMANVFYESGSFSFSEPDWMVDDQLLCKNDPLFDNQWALKNTNLNPGSGVDIKYCDAQTVTQGSSDIVVAVLDHGVDLNHPDLTNMSPLSFDNETGTSPSKMWGSHGTACAGIIGADNDNNLGVSGIASDCPIMSISDKLIGYSGSSIKRADGINFAWQNGASVISNSWKAIPSQVLDDAITAAMTNGRNGFGCVVVFATGNSNYNVSYPANSNPDIIAVGALSPCGERKSPSSCDGELWGSNYGPELDIVAPGVKIPTTDRPGSLGYSLTDFAPAFNGTSSACPHVAGVAALVLSVNPMLTQKQVADIIESTAQKIGSYFYTNNSARPNGTWNNEMGYGVLDANAAVESALALLDPNKIFISTSSTNPDCYDPSSGSIDLTVSGGDVNYSFIWNTGSTSMNLNNLVAGVYEVTVTDGIGNTASKAVELTDPIGVSASFYASTCNINGIDVNIYVSNGTPPFVFQWSDSAVNSDYRSGLLSQQYFVTITDAIGCDTVLNIDLSDVEVMTVQHTITNATCKGIDDGSIDLQVNGGSGIYGFSWSNGSTSEDLTAVGSGNYWVYVYDKGGPDSSCSQVITGLQVKATNSINIDKNISHPTCEGGNGSIELSVTGGFPAYDYSWSTGQTTQNLYNLNQGFYSVSVTDAAGCYAEESTYIYPNDSFVVLLYDQDITCGSQNSGSINLEIYSPDSSTGNYTYTWSNGATTQHIYNLPGGLYTVTVQNVETKCEKVATEKIDYLGGIELSSYVANTCGGMSSGSIYLIVSGGSGGYSYQWSTGDTAKYIDSLTAGTYYVTVSDTLGCTQEDSVIVGEGLPIEITGIVTGGCAGDNGGSIDVTITGGDSSYYQVYWTDGVYGEDRTGLKAGLYTVNVTDSSGCFASKTFEVEEYDAITISGVVTDAACSGKNDGSIDITVVGGTGDYSYLWNTGDSSEDLSGLAPGYYNVVVFSQCKLAYVAHFTVSEQDSLTVIGNVTQPTCLQPGSIELLVLGGSGDYAFEWSNGSTVKDQSQLGTGTYTVTVSDSGGCNKVASFHLYNYNVLNAKLTTSNTCYDDSTGSIDLVVYNSGGAGDYSYVWSNGATTKDLQNLTAGYYEVTITDDSTGCTTTKGAWIQSVELDIIKNVHDACENDSTGYVSISVQGLASWSYSVLWDNGSTSKYRYDLEAGNYMVTVSANSGCSKVDTVVIGEVPGIEINATIEDACPGQSNGSILLNVTGGAEKGYFYHWNGIGYQKDLINITSGIYQVSVFDSSCYASKTVTVNEADSLIVLANKIDATCNGMDGSISLDISGGKEPYYIVWSDSTFGASRDSLAPGNYTVYIEDACYNMFAKTITILGVGGLDSNATITAAKSTICEGAQTLLVASGGDSYYWPHDGSVTPFNFVAPSTTTTYTVIISKNGCSTEKSIVVYVVPLPDPIVYGDTVICKGDTANLVVLGGDNYFWPHSWEKEDSVQVLPDSTTTYQVLVGDTNNCVSHASILVQVMNPEPEIAIIYGDPCIKGRGKLGVNQKFSSYSWSSGSTKSTIVVPMKGAYSVTVEDQYGCFGETSINLNCGSVGPRSSELEASLETEDNPLVSNLNVYPNPTSGEVNIALSSAFEGELNIDVFNSLGQRVLYKTIDVKEGNELNTSISLDSNPAGMYILSISSDNQQHLTRIVLE